MRTEMILRKLERPDRQTCFGTFIEEDTRQQDKQLIESYLSRMSIPETSCHAETGKGSTWTNVEGKYKASALLCGCDSSGVSNRNRPLPPRRRRTSAAARPPRRGPPAPPGAAAFGLGEAATRLAPRVKAWANESWWKTRKLRKLRIPKIIVQYKHCTPSDKRMPREIQGEEGAVADEETWRNWLWLGIGKVSRWTHKRFFKLLRTLYN